MKSEYYIYQLEYGHVFSSRIKAHNTLCDILKKDRETYLPSRETLGGIPGTVYIEYPYGQIIRRLVN